MAAVGMSTSTATAMEGFINPDLQFLLSCFELGHFLKTKSRNFRKHVELSHRMKVMAEAIEGGCLNCPVP